MLGLGFIHAAQPGTEPIIHEVQKAMESLKIQAETQLLTNGLNSKCGYTLQTTDKLCSDIVPSDWSTLSHTSLLGYNYSFFKSQDEHHFPGSLCTFSTLHISGSVLLLGILLHSDNHPLQYLNFILTECYLLYLTISLWAKNQSCLNYYSFPPVQLSTWNIVGT